MNFEKCYANMQTKSGQWSNSAKSKTTARKLLQWLADKTRTHDTVEDEKVLRTLLSSNIIQFREIINAEIPLLPAMPYSPITHYAKDLVEYLEAYVSRPMRPPTIQESWNMINYTISHTSYPKESMSALLNAGYMIPPDTISTEGLDYYISPIATALSNIWSEDNLKIFLEKGISLNYTFQYPDGKVRVYNFKDDILQRERTDLLHLCN